MTCEQMEAAARAICSAQHVVWDGQDEGGGAASAEVLRPGLEAKRKRRGRPAGSGTKEQIAIRLDRDLLAAFREGGRGWQTRINDVLRDWLKARARI